METPQQTEPRTYQHPIADDWVWTYFFGLRQDADLAAHAAGGTLTPDAFTYVANAEELPSLRETVPALQEAEVSELEQTLHDLDAAFARFAAGFAAYPPPHLPGTDPGRGPTTIAA
jgi:hypothetical protein